MGRMRTAFTLIEILVVVSIIALLCAVLLPSLSSARNQARRASCAAKLHQVGIAMKEYMHDSRDHMPWCSYMPSISPAPLDLTKPPIYFASVLGRSFKGGAPGGDNVLECPNDRSDSPWMDQPRDPPNTGRTYYQTERSSYEFRTQLNGLSPQGFDQLASRGPWHQRRAEHKATPNTVWFARDYNNFHGKGGQMGARRYVYIDAHVSDWEN